MASEAERNAMRRAVEISRAALGSTNPNPCVGAVVFDSSGHVIGEGVTQPVGGDHAEVGALRAAGAQAQGSTLVVTLEPCAHVGRTQPCTDLIIAAKVAKVVYALADPHDLAAGGAEALRAAGIAVEAGLLAEPATTVLGRWTTAMAGRRPHVTWKYAASLDGRIAAADGTSQWITGDVARRDVHRERYLADAVIAGIGTVLADDPQLTVRDWPATRQPTRIVIDSDARTPSTARVLDGSAPTVIVVAADADLGRTAALTSAGATVIPIARHSGRVDLGLAMHELFDRGIAIGFVEGGATLATGLLQRGLVDRFVGYYAPMVLGAGLPMIGDIGVDTLAAACRLTVDDVALIGDDVRIDARLLKRSA